MFTSMRHIIWRRRMFTSMRHETNWRKFKNVYICLHIISVPYIAGFFDTLLPNDITFYVLYFRLEHKLQQYIIMINLQDSGLIFFCFVVLLGVAKAIQVTIVLLPYQQYQLDFTFLKNIFCHCYFLQGILYSKFFESFELNFDFDLSL